MINGKDDPPNLATIIKVLKMTTSSHDGEALSAIRMANDLLRRWGWEWEAIMNGKVKILPDPFANIPMPVQSGGSRYQAAPPAPPPPPKTFDNRDEIEKYFDKINTPGRKIPHDIAKQLASIERAWNANGHLIWKDYDFLRQQANRRYR